MPPGFFVPSKFVLSASRCLVRGTPKSMSTLETLEALSYVVTIVGLPFAIWIFIIERRKQRLKEDEEVYLKLADDYEEFLKLVLEHADLHLMTPAEPTPVLSPDQLERKNVLFEILISIFERAYILVYEERLTGQTARLWSTWEDYMRAWCRRRDFRDMLPKLLEGEDPDFQAHIRRIAAEEARTAS